MGDASPPSTTTTTTAAAPPPPADLDLDDILSNALDELDDEDSPVTTSAPSPPLPPSSSSSSTSPPPPPSSSSDTTTPVCSTNGHHGGGAGQDETEDLSAEEKELKDTIEKTIAMLQRGSEDADQQVGEESFLNDAFLEQLATEFEKMGREMKEAGGEASAGGESVVDDVVKHLLCKELMYPPLKQITEQYPSWLESHRGRMEAGVFGKYEEQHRLFIQIVEVYEKDGDNFNRLLDLMTKVQEYGQPPKEIVEQLLPEGMPPELSPFGPLTAGLGAGGGGAGDQCVVM